MSAPGDRKRSTSSGFTITVEPAPERADGRLDRDLLRDASLADDPRFRAAMLKIAFELRRSSDRDFQQVLDETLCGMDIDRDAFRRYLAGCMDLMMAQARRR